MANVTAAMAYVQIAADFRSVTVAIDGVNAAAKGGILHDKPNHQHHRNGNENDDWYAAKQIPRTRELDIRLDIANRLGAP